MLNIEELADSLKSGSKSPPRFPESWVEVVALEYTKLHAVDVKSASAFAQQYLDAQSEIRAWLSNGRPRV